MKILHTADWHLGKTLFGINLLPLQEQALDQLTQVIKSQNVELLLICGDIFDTFVPKSEAQKLFYSKLLKISSMCKVVALSGNHDDGERLSAPSGIASQCGIELFNSYNGLKTKINGEKINIATLAYPFVTRLISQTQGENNIERISSLIEKSVEVFDSGINIFASHLFILGSELSEERELGTAPMLPKSILPNCDYCALGHIHKTQKISLNAYYSGSLLKYSFDDKFNKSFLIFDTNTKEVSYIPIVEQKQLLSFNVFSFDEAMNLLTNNQNAFIKLDYNGTPLTPNELKQIKSQPSFVQIVLTNKQSQVNDISKQNMDSKQLFELFFKTKMGKEPDNETTQLFLSLLNEEA